MCGSPYPGPLDCLKHPPVNPSTTKEKIAMHSLKNSIPVGKSLSEIQCLFFLFKIYIDTTFLSRSLDSKPLAIFGPVKDYEQQFPIFNEGFLLCEILVRSLKVAPSC